MNKVKELSLWMDKQRRKKERAEDPVAWGGWGGAQPNGGASGRWSAALFRWGRGCIS